MEQLPAQASPLIETNVPGNLLIAIRFTKVVAQEYTDRCFPDPYIMINDAFASTSARTTGTTLVLAFIVIGY
jgi:hypothetical protein